MKQRGFTLLEVLVAAAIMGIAVAGVLGALSTTMRSAARLTDYDRAVMLGRSKMDELLLDPHFPRDTVITGEFERAMIGGLEGGWRAMLTRYEKPPAPAQGEHALDRMELEVWWISNGQRHNFRLDAYRDDVLRPQEVGS